MKKLYTILAAVLITASTFAQAPEKMSYQAVVRDSGDNLVTSQPVGMQISILQGSASGTVAYVETQTQTTNVNGLVTLEIGTGTTTDDFTSIDWANGPYFIKTEIDPSGSTTYTITGTSQLMSVPYALNAKTADNGITTQQASDITANNAKVGITTAQADAITANTAGSRTLAVGQSYQGGKIFWLDATGQHGLIAATADQSTGIQWHNGTYSTLIFGRNGIGAGMYNTERIIAIQGSGSYAANLCARYTGGGYGDWYLPSIHELDILYVRKTAVGGFTADYYWSSSVNDFRYAYIQSFGSGDKLTFDRSFAGRVRAIRAF